MQNKPLGPLLTASIVLGIIIFAVGFRMTSEVTVVLALLVLAGVVFGALWPERAWLWGLGLGIGTRISDLLPGGIFHEPALSPEHVAKYGKSKPLPLPFGLTGNPIAEWIAASLLIMAFPMVGACIGWILRRGAAGLSQD